MYPRRLSMNRAAKSATPRMLQTPAFASIEVLGQPPLAHARGHQHAERVLSLLLLLCICVASGWQFWTDSQRHGAYQQGVRAAAGQDWEVAWAAYRAAAGYSDADRRAVAAGRLAAEQRELVRQAAVDRRRCDGAGLALVVRRLQVIAPRAPPPCGLAACWTRFRTGFSGVTQKRLVREIGSLHELRGRLCRRRHY
jgi:hypothetical protein